MLKRVMLAGAVCSLMSIGTGVSAAVTAEEAARLKTVLTPLGGERTGNKEGTIPAWAGGYTKVPAGFKPGDRRADPFAAEKPLFQINAKNMGQYSDRLSEGMKAIITKYPDTFSLHVYPTHRTASAPTWVYENTAKNAINAKTNDGGYSISGAIGGAPFPIPKDGYEVIWNHLLRWRGESAESTFQVINTASDGKHTLAVAANMDLQFPYYYKGATQAQDYMYLRQTQTAPPFKAGEQILLKDPVEMKGRQAWQYLAGQRRVRRAPTIAFDTPDFVASGMNYFDEVMMYLGSIERYEWKLVGKKEVYVPYNENMTVLAKAEEMLAKHHMNPDKMRWELHRVWVVEASLAPGKRHAVPKRRFYVDEDSWAVLLAEGYDAEGKLWRVQHAIPFVAPDMPGIVTESYVLYNLQAGTWMASNIYNDMPQQYVIVPPKADTYFSPDTMAGAGVR